MHPSGTKISGERFPDEGTVREGRATVPPEVVKEGKVHLSLIAM